ncbi:cytochrome P450 [Pleomassaria siparia CBS 279.74]|uniref:Cytochrome P450 n=1 Tax=Pleomassaria siparia CBS 279.74 TaxID=1314801 RepID=A0A6G1JV34_9PLEO|nr:cytochrome P450 [Pleomassaria siparia CBS 279.74]
MLATPNGNMLWTCDPSIIKQLFTLQTIRLPVDMFAFFDMFGPTLGSVDGDEWKVHRKVVTHGLGPSLLPVMWKETIKQTHGLVQLWKDSGEEYGEKGCGEVGVVKEWTSRLALHVLAGVMFGKELLWGEYKKDGDDAAGKKELGEDEEEISFQSALFTFVARMGLIFITPRLLLNTLPIKACREVSRALSHFTSSMQGLRAQALSNIHEKAPSNRRKTILESIAIAGSMDSLPEASVLGNIYFTLMAGHETTGSALGFSMLLLAIYPEYQIKIHNQLDSLFDKREEAEWNVEHDYPALKKGYMGHFIKEVLRAYCPLQFGLRRAIAPTTLTDSHGQAHMVPADTLCLVNFAAAFQNPSTFSPRANMSASRKEALHHSPAIDFDPDRWAGDRTEGFEASEGSDAVLHIPFGHGARKCPGQPFAQVEIVAFLASLLKGNSVELAVDDGVLLGECGGDKEKAWETTRDDAIRKMKDEVTFGITLQMLEKLPLRVVTRGD